MKMIYIRNLFILLFMLPLVVRAQEIFSPSGYQSAMISNPGMTGSEGNGYIRLSYLNYYPGNSFNLHSAMVSYDGYFPSLHGGAGIYLSDNYLGGMINDVRGGLSYSYYFQAGEKLFISAGLSGSFYHRGYDFGGAILPDQIDPLHGAVYPSGEALSAQGRTVFDIGTGFLLMTDRFFGGISVSHLAQPDLTSTDFTDEKLLRSILLHLSVDVGIDREKNLLLRPTGELKFQGDLITSGIGAAFESNYLAFNTLLYLNNLKNIDLQAGFNINPGAGIIIFYNYRFNIASPENLLPVTVLHHAGVAVSLNNVDKRKIVKTINFPKL